MTICEIEVVGFYFASTSVYQDLVPALLGGSCAAGDAGTRVCGAVSQDSIGWGGEPDRAIDGNRDTNYGGGSCMHTNSGSGGAWFQIDLGSVNTIDRVAIYHRTDCCQDRLESALILVSTSPDFNTGVICGQVGDHTQEPEVSQCGGAAEGQYITVDLAGGGGGTSDGQHITICEIEIYGVPADQLAAPGDEVNLIPLISGLPAQYYDGTCHSAVGQTTSALYEFNGNADDSTGTNHGMITGAVLSPDRFGVAGAAYTFDGDDYITVGTPFGAGNEDYSIAVWLSPSIVDDGSWHGFVGYQEGTTRSPSMWVNYNGGGQGDGLAWDTRTTQNGDGTRLSGVIPNFFVLNTYVQVVWTTEAGALNRFYKDGALVSDGSQTAGAHVDLHDVYEIGRVDNFFYGTIDEVGFYDFQLSATDVENLHTAQATVDAAAHVPDNYDPRICGAVSQSSIGWGGEPNRAIDGDNNPIWGSGSCSHTADMDGPSWFQVDLGAISTIDRVAIYHRSDCCQDRLESSRIMVSDTTDYSRGVRCGILSDHSNTPEVSGCGGAAEGRYVTISLQNGAGQAGVRALMTICEIEVWGSCWRPGCPALYSATDVVTGTHLHVTLNSAQTVRSCEHGAPPGPQINISASVFCMS